MEIKVDKDGNVVTEKDDGGKILPVYVYDDGSEHPFDAKATLKSKDTKISGQKEEIDRHFKKNEKLKADLKVFDGVDVKQAKDDAEFREKFKDSKLVDEQGVEALKKQMNLTHQEELDRTETKWKTTVEEQQTKNEKLEKLIFKQTTLNQFATSPLFTGDDPKIKLHPEYAASIYKDNVKTEIEEKTGKIITRIINNDGEVILSKKKHGDEAGFTEGLEILIESDPRKDTILNPGKSGGPDAKGNLKPGTKEFSKLSPTEKIKAGLEKRKRA